MRQTLLISAVNHLEATLLKKGTDSIANLLLCIPQIQQEYELLIKQALVLLAEQQRNEAMHLLSSERQQVLQIMERLGTLVERVEQDGSPFLMAVTEFLHSRGQLLHEVKMFPEFGIEVLNRTRESEIVEETLNEAIAILEFTMTGKKNLYQQVMAEYANLQDPS